MKSSTETLIKSLKILAEDIQSEDGVANSAIFESATRLDELQKENNRLKDALDEVTDIGIYPESVIGGDNGYEKRTEYMEGWNDCQKEVINIIKNKLEMSKINDSPYCLICGACGEEGCCTGAKCLYGDYYAKEYLYHKEMADTLYEEFPDKERLKEIFNQVWEKHFGK
jgi:hypothetical protein